MKLLIIDDSDKIRSSILKMLNFIPEIDNVIEAFDVDDGIRIINECNPEIIIIDLMLKTGTGIDVIKNIEKKLPKPIFILYSNFLSEKYISIAKELGVDYFFDKSSDILVLMSLIQKKVKELNKL